MNSSIPRADATKAPGQPTPLLMIDDDRELGELLRDYLSPEGFDLTLVHDGQSGLDLALSGSYCLLILDVMLPNLNGLEVLRGLRQRSAVPVLMLTARGDDVDRIVGLELGADDYLPKPFNPRELVARIRAVLRRLEGRSHSVAPERPGPAPIVVDDLVLKPWALDALRDGRSLGLTTAEYGLLEMLVVSSVGTPVSRDDLSERVLGRRLSAFDRSIDVHMSNLRKKLARGPSDPERIKSVRGFGYLYVREGGK